MGDGDVQSVDKVVAEILPVDRAWPQLGGAKRHDVLQPVGRDLILIGRHHFGDGGLGLFQPRKDEAVPDLLIQRKQTVTRFVERVEILPCGDALERAVQPIAPGMIGTDEPVSAIAACTVGQPGGAMTADIVEAAHGAIGPAQRHQPLAKNIEGVIVAGSGNVIHMAYELPRLGEELTALALEEVRIAVEPRRKAFFPGFVHESLRKGQSVHRTGMPRQIRIVSGFIGQ